MFEYFASRFFTSAGVINPKAAEEIMIHLKNAEFSQQEVDTINNEVLKPNHIALIKMLQNAIDEKLGDLASEYEGLTDAQISSMVKKQAAINTIFVGNLVKGGFVQIDNITNELNKLRNYYGLNSPGISRNLKEDFDQILGQFIKSDDYYSNEYATIALKYILRFIGTGIKFSESSNVKSYQADRIILQKIITSGKRYFIAIASDKLSLQAFNDGIENVFKAETPNARYASLYSFMNCITNIFQCIIAKEKEILLVDSPNVYKHSTITVNEDCYLLPMMVEDMKLDILVGSGEKPYCSTISHNI